MLDFHPYFYEKESMYPMIWQNLTSSVNLLHVMPSLTGFLPFHNQKSALLLKNFGCLEISDKGMVFFSVPFGEGVCFKLYTVKLLISKMDGV